MWIECAEKFSWNDLGSLLRSAYSTLIHIKKINNYDYISKNYFFIVHNLNYFHVYFLCFTLLVISYPPRLRMVLSHTRCSINIWLTSWWINGSSKRVQLNPLHTCTSKTNIYSLNGKRYPNSKFKATLLIHLWYK